MNEGVELKFKVEKEIKEEPIQIQDVELIVKEETEINQEPYQCSQSDLVFSNNINLTNHLRTENGKKSYQCSQCHKISHLRLILKHI